MRELPSAEPCSSTDLLHLLTCETCRSFVIGRLLDQHAAPWEEDTRDETYAASFDRLEELTPELIEQARTRREAVEQLLTELRHVSQAQRLQMITAPRFRSVDLLDRLLEESHSLQLGDPAFASDLASLASRLASQVEEVADREATLARALCLDANAKRLDSRFDAADALLAQAGPRVSEATERAFFCRTLALLRWEQGRTDEAEALVQHAACLYARHDMDHEVGACLTILGLILHEEGGHGDVLALLTRGWAEMDREQRACLALRGGLTLVSRLAQAGQGERARGVLADTWKLYGQVSDCSEMLRVYWLEGRARARLGEHEEAVQLLESVRLKLLGESSLAETALVSLDLAVIFGETDRPNEIAPLATDLEVFFPDHKAMVIAAEKIRRLAVLARRGDARLGEAGYESTVTLRRLFRASGLRPKPLPAV